MNAELRQRVAQVETAVETLPGRIHDANRRAFREAITDVLQDQQLTAAFWRQGYDLLQQRAVAESSQWVGKRLMTALITAVTVAGFVWLVKTGGLK